MTVQPGHISQYIAHMDNVARRKLLGDAIRKTRMERGLSQRQLASLLGANSHSYLNEIEKGSKSVGFDKICSIADALGCDVKYFFMQF